MRFSHSFDGENLQEVKINKTPKEFEKALEIIDEYVQKADSTDPQKKVVCGLPGILDKEKKTLVKAPNLPFWENKPIKEKLGEIINAETLLTNDASLAGLGEAVIGAGKDHKIIAYLTFGTGVGGVRIVEGKIDQHVWGFEPGHQIITLNLNNGKSIEIEDVIGGRKLEQTYGMRAEDITDKDVWLKVHKFISIAITNTCVYWSPDAVIIGGGLLNSEHISIDKVRDGVKNMLKIFPVVPEIKMWELKDEAALYGGLQYLRQN